MPLNIKDLRDEEARLKGIVQHAEKELTAIRMLISGREMRQEEVESSSRSLVGMTIRSAVEAIVAEWIDRRFTSAEMHTELKSRGFENEAHLRANVGNALKDLSRLNKLDREDVGEDKLVKYEYFKKEDQQ